MTSALFIAFTHLMHAYLVYPCFSFPTPVTSNGAELLIVNLLPGNAEVQSAAFRVHCEVAHGVSVGYELVTRVVESARKTWLALPN